MSRRLLLVLHLVILTLMPAVAPQTQAAGPSLSQSYSSGWRALQPGQQATLDHNLGSDDPALYAVDLMMLDERPLGLGIHQRGYGGMLIDEDHVGMHWQRLTENQLGVHRGAQDLMAVQFLLRVWQPATPHYDSGWIEVAAGRSQALTHNLGGDPADYVASLKFRSADASMGINQYALGGLAGEAYAIGGAFAHLDDERVVLTRLAEDEHAAEMRLLIYAEPPGGPPAYDSGWVDLAHNAVQNLTHDLDTAPGQLVVRTSQRSTTHGINNRALGGMELGHFYYGAGWQNLTENTISLFRLAHDPYATQARVRIWRSSEPCVPSLLTPAQGALMDNGCADGSDEMVWPFSWSACPGATAYHLYVIGSEASVPIIDLENLTTSSYTDTSYSTVHNGNLLGWRWKVRALVNGAWGEWSTERTYDVEPLNTDCPSAPVCLPLVMGG